MSPINSNSSDRDFEAIHRAQRAHEPSMEEILASIRNIIADDPARGAALKAPQPAPTPTPQIVYSKDAAALPGDASGAVPAPRRERADGRLAPAASRRSRALSRRPSNPARSRCCRRKPAKRSALSFGALSANLEVRSAELADSMVRDMLRPMVKAVAGRQPPGDGRAAGPGGNPEGRARAEVGSRRPSRVDFDRDDAFIAPVALAPAASVAIRSARKAAA